MMRNNSDGGWRLNCLNWKGVKGDKVVRAAHYSYTIGIWHLNQPGGKTIKQKQDLFRLFHLNQFDPLRQQVSPLPEYF